MGPYILKGYGLRPEMCLIPFRGSWPAVLRRQDELHREFAGKGLVSYVEGVSNTSRG